MFYIRLATLVTWVLLLLGVFYLGNTILMVLVLSDPASTSTIMPPVGPKAVGEGIRFGVSAIAAGTALGLLKTIAAARVT